jgi:hypothetical protein
VEGEEEDEELWLLKRPIDICQSGTSPFFEGEAELQNPPNIVGSEQALRSPKSLTKSRTVLRSQTSGPEKVA